MAEPPTPALPETPPQNAGEPPTESRIFRISHGGQVDVEQLRRQGFGGVVTNVPFDDGYTANDALIDRWVAQTRALHEAGLGLWLYDEAGYPSGRAGDRVLQGHPELEARALFAASTDVHQAGPVRLDLPPGTVRLAAAFARHPDGLDLAHPADLAACVAGRQLAWDAPAGDWCVVAVTEDRLYTGTQVDGYAHPKQAPYVDLLNPQTTARFLAVTHERYAQALGPDLGRWFEATFTDEPSSIAVFFAAQPWRPLPWTARLPDEFRARRGYALEPNLLAALVVEAGVAGQRTRYDYWLTVRELMAESFLLPLRDWCRAHGLPSGGHFLLEENLLHHVPLYGDLFHAMRLLDAPGIDVLSCRPQEPSRVAMHLMATDVPWYAARLASSAADFEGRALVMSETSDIQQKWHQPPLPVSAAEFRGAFNRLLLGGITRHNTYSRFEGLSDADLLQLNRWVGRCGQALTGGHRVADVAVLYPIETAWVRFTPSRRGVEDVGEEAKRLALVFRETGDALYTARREFLFVDSAALAAAAVRPGGELVHGPLAWRIVVLPDADTLPLAAWQNLERFWTAGGVVVSVAAGPANSETAFPCPEVQALGRRLFGTPDRRGRSWNANSAGGLGIALPYADLPRLGAALSAVLEPDLDGPEADAPVRYAHRRVGGHEVFLVINDSEQTWTGRLRFAAAGTGECLDPATGSASPRSGADQGDVSLEPWGGRIFRFERAVSPRRRAPAAPPWPADEP